MTDGDARRRSEPVGRSRCSAACGRPSRARRPQQAAFSKYLDERSDREDARAERTHGAEGVIPAPLWAVLILSAGILFVFMLFFADSGERALVQGMMIGGVAVLVSSLLLLLWFLDNPYHDGVGALEPVAMENTIDRPAAGGRDRRRRRAALRRVGRAGLSGELGAVDAREGLLVAGGELLERGGDRGRGVLTR